MRFSPNIANTLQGLPITERSRFKRRSVSFTLIFDCFGVDKNHYLNLFSLNDGIVIIAMHLRPTIRVCLYNVGRGKHHLLYFHECRYQRSQMRSPNDMYY